MSRENVELVRKLQPGPGVDLAALFRDVQDAGLARTYARFFQPDCEYVLHWPGAEPATYRGLNGLRDAWLDWLTPWANYRTEIEELVDLGDSVVVLVLDYARREPRAPEIRQMAAAVWTVSEGRIARAEFYLERDEALKAVGLAR